MSLKQWEQMRQPVEKGQWNYAENKASGAYFNED